jgi:hypothetical protein
VIFGRFAPWAWGRHPRQTFLATSAAGIPDPPKEIFDSARFWYIEWSGIARISRRIYRDRFFRTVDLDYGRFAKLPYPVDQKKAINSRVLACIRISTAFSAWEEVSWAMVEVGFRIAIVAGALSGVIATMLLFGGAASRLQLALAADAIAIAVVVASVFALAVPRSWPTCAVMMVALAAGAASLLRGVMTYTTADSTLFDMRTKLGTNWVPFAEAVLWTAIALWTVFAVALSVSAVFFIRATARRIARYPEEEIIRTLASVLGELSDPKTDWRSGIQRGKIVDRLEWVARRFENQFVDRYMGRDHATDTVLQQTATRCASRVRAQKRMVVFPSKHTLADLTAFLWSALQNAALHTWDAIEGDEVAEIVPSRRERFVAGLRATAAVVGPAAFSLAFQSTTADPGIKTNVLITGLAWSALMVLALLNPKQFENQLSAAKSIGSVIKKSGSG